MKACWSNLCTVREKKKCYVDENHEELLCEHLSLAVCTLEYT